MMHAENGMAIDVVAAQTRRGRARPTRTATASPARPSSRARRPTGSSAWPRRPACRSTSSTSRRSDALDRGPRGPRPRHEGLRRDLPAVPVPVARRPGQRLRWREVRVLPSPATEGPLGRAVDRAGQGRPPARRDRSLPVRLPRPEGARAAATSARSRTACRASRTGSTCSTTAASSAGRITPRALGRDHLDGAGQDVRDVPAEGRDRRRLRRRHRHLRPEPPPHDLGIDPPHGRRLLVLRGPRASRAASDIVLSRGSVIVRDGEFTGRAGQGRFIKRAPADHARMS